jgi:hypothetical protein
VHDEGGFVPLAALGHGREIGGVGLDQDAVQRHVAHDGAQILGVPEGDDARQGDVEAHVEGPLGQRPA